MDLVVIVECLRFDFLEWYNGDSLVCILFVLFQSTDSVQVNLLCYASLVQKTHYSSLVLSLPN